MGQNGIDNDLLKVSLWNFIEDNAGVLLGRSAKEWVIAGFASSASHGAVTGNEARTKASERIAWATVRVLGLLVAAGGLPAGSIATAH
jgi:hypothetical protein